MNVLDRSVVWNSSHAIFKDGGSFDQWGTRTPASTDVEFQQALSKLDGRISGPKAAKAIDKGAVEKPGSGALDKLRQLDQQTQNKVSPLVSGLSSNFSKPSLPQVSESPAAPKPNASAAPSGEVPSAPQGAVPPAPPISSVNGEAGSVAPDEVPPAPISSVNGEAGSVAPDEVPPAPISSVNGEADSVAPDEVPSAPISSVNDESGSVADEVPSAPASSDSEEPAPAPPEEEPPAAPASAE